MKANPEELSEDLREELYFEEGSDELSLIEEGDFEDYGKGSSKTNIYKHKETNKYYALDVDRMGSYYSDYYWDFSTPMYEVEEVEVVKTEWERV